jgi:GNAT superfamily N-acetyltransferase
MTRDDAATRPVTADDAAWVSDLLREHWGSSRVARLGEVIDAAAVPGYVAVVAGRRAGHVGVLVRGNGCEVVSLTAVVRRRGVGRALVARAAEHARAAGCRRLWLVTTNDNAGALVFYQRIGLDLAALHRDDVTRSRELKPGIPLTGEHGLPLRHTLEFELLLEP